VARRLVRFASEDVGLADPQALVIAMAAQQAVHFVGMPEGALALAQLVVYLAAAPKSNAVYKAYGEAAATALESRAEPVPLWIRNAPTRLMKGLGYGQGYRYAHDEEEGVAGMDSLPDRLAGRRFYHPTDRGVEKELAERLATARALREEKKNRAGS
jgi:putative ATPase